MSHSKRLICGDRAQLTAAIGELAPRRRELADSLRPGRREAVDALVSQMLYGFTPPSGTVSPARVAATAADLYQFPEWAVKAGLSKAAKAVKDPAFPPSSVECLEAVHAACAPYFAELRDIDRVAKAEIAPPANPERAAEVLGVIRSAIRPSVESRARVQKMVDDFKASIPPDSGRPKATRLPTIEEAEARLESPPAHWSGPVPISHELGEKLGLTPEQIDAFARDVCR